MNTYEDTKDTVFASYSDNIYNAVPRANFQIGAFAKISNMSTSVNGDKATLSFDYSCDVSMRATQVASGENDKEICMLGAMYRVEYKKNNCN